MKILGNLKRSLAYLLVATMLLSCVDSLSVKSYAEEYAGQDISANETTSGITGTPDVPQTGDTNNVTVSGDDGNSGNANINTDGNGGNDTSANDTSNNGVSANGGTGNGSVSNNDVSTNDVSDNDVSTNDVSDNDVSNNDVSTNDVSTNDVSTNDVSDNDVSDNDVSNNDVEEWPAIIVRVEGDPSYSVSCNDLAEAQEATKAYYNEKNSGVSGNDYFAGKNHIIRWDIYTDLTLTGNNDFLDNEGIAPFIRVWLCSHTSGGRTTYSNIIVPANKTIETTASFSYDVAPPQDNMEAFRLVLGSKSKFTIYTSSKMSNNSGFWSYFWRIEDTNSNATFTVSKAQNYVERYGDRPCIAKVDYIGTKDHPLGNLICESGENGTGSLTVMADLYAKSAETRLFEKTEGNIGYHFASRIETYGTAVVDAMNCKGSIEVAEGSTFTIKNLTADANGSIGIVGDLVITEKLDVKSKDNGSTSLSITCKGDDFGCVYFPANIVTNKYKRTYSYSDGSTFNSTFVTEICFHTTKQTNGTWGGADFEIGKNLFYVTDKKNATDRIKVMGKDYSYKTYVFKDAVQKDGKTYYPAQLAGKAFWYAEAKEDGSFPEYTPEHTGLTQYPTEYADYTKLVEGLSTVEFSVPGNVKVYIPVNDNSSLDASGNEFAIRASAKVSEIEFVGDNTYSPKSGGTYDSWLNFRNSALPDNEQYKVSLYTNVIFKNLQIGCYNGTDFVFDIKDKDLTFTNLEFYCYRMDNGSGGYTSYNGLPNVMGTGTLTVRNTYDIGNPWEAVSIGNFDVSHLVLDGIIVSPSPFYRYMSFKDGIDIDFLRGAQLYPSVSDAPGFEGHSFGTVTVKKTLKNDPYYTPLNPNKSMQAYAGCTYSIDKLVLEDGVSCAVYLNGYDILCSGINDLEIGKNAKLTTDWDAKLILTNLTVKENGILSTGLVKVTGDTVLTYNSNIVMQSTYYNYSYDEKLKQPEFNTITLVKSESSVSNESADSSQYAYISWTDWKTPIRLINGIKRETDGIKLRLRRSDSEGNYVAPLDVSTSLIKLLYDDADKTSDDDLELIAADGGYNVTHPIMAEKSTETEAPYGVIYIVKPIGIGVYAAQKGEPFEKAKLLSAFTTYSDAINYINTVGNANMQYYVGLKKTVITKQALSFPKVGAGFGIVGLDDDDTARLRILNSVKLPMNTLLQNVTIISETKGASLDLGGKDLALVNATLTDYTGKIMDIVGTAGNLSIAAGTTRQENRADQIASTNNTKPIKLKSLTLTDIAYIISGSLEVTGDVKLINSSIKDSTAIGKIGGNLYMENSDIIMTEGTLTVAKNLYALKSTIVPAYTDTGDKERLYLVANYGKPTGLKVTGNTYIDHTDILVTGDVDLANVYSGRENMVYYGTGASNFFKVKTVISTEYADVNASGVYSGSDEFGWTVGFEAGASQIATYKVVGKKCDEVAPAVGDLDDVTALATAINVRRAYVEKDYYNNSYEDDNDALSASNKLALCYKAKGQSVTIVSTSDSPTKFIVGKKSITSPSAVVSIYSLKSTGAALVIDNIANMLVVLTDNYGLTLGKYDSVAAALARITALKDGSKAYVITIDGDAEEGDRKATNTSANLVIPKVAEAKRITIQASGDSATVRFKDALAINTDVTFKNIKFETGLATGKYPNVTLNGNKLRLEDCDSWTVNSVKGTKNSTFEISNTSFAEQFVVKADVAVDVLSLSNIDFKACGKGTVGKLVLFDGAGVGADKVRLGVNLDPKSTKVEKKTTITGSFAFLPTFTVSGAIENKGGEGDVFTVLPLAKEQSASKYVADLYKTANGSEVNAEDRTDWNKYVKDGLPLIIAPKAEVSFAELKYDESEDTAAVASNPAASGIIIKKYVGSSSCLCYSTSTYVPYTLKVGDEHVADYMTWADLTKSINAMANKRDYTVVLGSKEGVVNEAAEALTMPGAAAISSLYIKAESGTPTWKYTTDKITLTCSTKLENINLAGTDSVSVLNISAPAGLTVSGNVTFGGRPVIIDGGKKGNLVLEDGAKMANTTVSDERAVDLCGAVKNMAMVMLGGATLKLKSYNVKGKATAPEFSVTNIMMSGDTIDVDGGKITIANLMASDAASIIASDITVTGKTDVKTDNLYFGGYKEGSLKLNGVIEVDDGCTIKVDPYAVLGDPATNQSLAAYWLANATEAKGPFTFVTAAKAQSASIFKAAYLDGGGNVQVTDYSHNDKDFFLAKKGNNIIGYNGYNARVAVSTLPKGTDPTGATKDLEGYYISYKEAVDSMNNKDKDFYLEVFESTSSLDVPIQITAPAAAKAASLTIFSTGDENVNVYYDKAISLANNVTFESVKLYPVKKAPAGSATIYVEGGIYPITVSGANTLTFSKVTIQWPNMRESVIKGINVAAGNVVLKDMGFAFIDGIKAKTLSLTNVKGDDGSGLSLGGDVTVDYLNLKNSRIGTPEYKTITVNKTLVSDDSYIWQNHGVLYLNDVEAPDTGDLSIRTTRGYCYIEIKGNVTGKFDLDIYGDEFSLAPMIASYALVENNLKNIKDANKIFVGKNVETSNINSLTVTYFGSVDPQEPEGYSVVKANGAFYLAEDATLGKKTVTLKAGVDGAENVYLDYSQAVARINEINKPDVAYTITAANGIEDTCLTDGDAYSKLTLPGDNKCSSLTVNANGKSLKYPGKAAVTAFGNVIFEDTKLMSVDATGNASVDSVFTLKVNSKANPKTSGLTLDGAGTLTVKAINGVKGVSNIVLTGTKLVATDKIDSIGQIQLQSSNITAAKLNNIGTIESDNAENEIIVTGTATVNDLRGDMRLFTSWYENTKALLGGTSRFVLSGTAEDGTVSVWPALLDKPEDIKLTEGSVKIKQEMAKVTIEKMRLAKSYDPPADFVEEDFSDEIIEETLKTAARNFHGTIPLLSAKKANASAFVGYGKEDPDTYVVYKTADWHLVSFNNTGYVLPVEVLGPNGFDTYARNWAEAVAIVDGVADKNAEYTFKLQNDNVYADAKAGSVVYKKEGENMKAFYTAGKFVYPKATSAKMITVTSGDRTRTLIYEGALSPTCNIAFDDVKLEERTKNAANADYASKLNATGKVTVAFTANTRNNAANELKFGALSVPKGTLQLGDETTIYAQGAVSVGNLMVNGDATIVPVASNKSYAKQTYGTIGSDYDGDATLTLTNCFSKAVPASAASQLSITGKIAPNVEVKMALKNAEYEPNGKGYKLATNPVSADSYESMDADYVSEFLAYTSLKSAPAAKTTVLNAPFLDASKLSVMDIDGFDFYKVNGSFYAVSDGAELAPVVKLETDIDPDADDGFELTAEFLTWEAAVTELNKVVNNDYKYKMTLLDNIGTAVYGPSPYKAGKNTYSVECVKSVDRAALPMPAKVEDLTIDGGGKDFIFTGTNVSIDSNIVFDNTRLVCLAKINSTTYGCNEKYKYVKCSYVQYVTSGALKLSIAKGRTVSLKNDGAINSSSIKAINEADESPTRPYVGYPYIGTIAGAAGSKLIIESGTIFLNGKISGLDTLEFETYSNLNTGYSGIAGKAQVPAINVGTLIIAGNSNLNSYNGMAVSVKTAKLSGGRIECDSFTANEVTFGDGGSNCISTRYGSKGLVNIKKINIASNMYNEIIAHQTAKGLTQITINELGYAEGYDNNPVNIGLFDTNGLLYAAFYDGQIVVNCPATVSEELLTLVSSDKANTGHVCGMRDIDWTFERGAGNKNIAFKVVAN